MKSRRDGGRLQRPMKEEQEYDKFTNQDCEERDRAILKQMIMPKRISPSVHVYTYGQLCGIHFVSDALHNDSARDHAGQNYVVYILQRTKRSEHNYYL